MRATRSITEDYKKSLKAIIRERTLFVTADCDTFLHVKSQAEPLIGEWGSGGGNFLMAIGLFALLNFLAKVHRYLVDPSQFVTPEYLDKLTASRSRIGKVIKRENDREFARTDKCLVQRYVRARVGEALNERQTFGIFVTVLRENDVDLGIPNQKVSEHLWDVFRNALTHMAMTREASVAAYDNMRGMTMAEAQTHVKRGRPAFFQDDKSTWVCNVDRLNLAVQDAGKWLCSEVDSLDDESTKRTLVWIRKQQGIAQSTLPVAEE